MSLDDEINKAVEDSEPEDPIDQDDIVENEDESEEEYAEEEPERPLNRQERRQIERDQRKAEKRELIEPTRPRQVDQQQQPRDRRPRSSITSKPISRYDVVDNPPNQLVPPGSGNTFVKSRMDQIMESGELAGKNRKMIADEYSKVQADVNAFIVWQAQREDYTIYQNHGYDEEVGRDKWVPAKYKFFPLTMGQHARLQRILARYNDLVRARDNNDLSVKEVNIQVDRAAIDIWKAKAELYFRMYVGRYYNRDTSEEVDADDPDGVLETEDEFEKTNQKDLDLAIQAYEWANLNLSSWKRQRSYAKSSLVTNSQKRMR